MAAKLTVKCPKPARFPAYTIESEAGETLATVPITASGNSHQLALVMAAAPELLATVKRRCPYCHADRRIDMIDGEAMHHVARGGDHGQYVPCALDVIERAAIAKAQDQ